MLKVDGFPKDTGEPSEYESLIAMGTHALNAIPGAIYLCDREGWLVRFNSEAVNLWGRTPALGEHGDRYCGSYRLYTTGGAPLAVDECPMASTLKAGLCARNQEVLIERPDGSRFVALMNIRTLRDRHGDIQGAINCFQDVSLHRALAQELRRKNSDLEDFFENSAVGLHIVSGDGIILRANKAELALLGYGADEYIGRHITEFHVDEPVIGDILNKLGSGDCLNSYPARLRAKDGSIKHVVITSNGRFEDGKFFNTRCFTIDVTRVHAAEAERQESERHMRNLLEALPAAVYTTDAEGRITFYNRAAVELSGRTPQLGDQWCVTWKLFNTDGSYLPHDQCPMAVALRENRSIRGVEAIAQRPDGTRVPFAPYPTPLHDADGNLIGAINMLVDITERKQAEDRQKTLIDELNHRVKNTLATVQSLAAQTARNALDAKDGYTRFEARLLALSRAHDLLTKRHWGLTPLGVLAQEVLMPVLGAEPGRIKITGDAIEVDTRVALSLTMTLNELAINALKYGAMSTETGTLSVIWSVQPQPNGALLTLDWREQHGPTVSTPAREGLGSRLMKRCIERDLGGSFELDFAPEGVHCRFSFMVAENKT
ncbi:PAS domain S-box protein [Pseudomonas fluorescens]|uniref:sensor histidine kinase n=1 Tax=Pseudomonas fluorescens TaxID=294 RepID=UPI0017854B03|nr:PAS domain S-box protein [Pseudomonas fluorescens]MBD8151005.1 PAS domain S-box protein [Pseudomonas fluorescens]MBD8179639.1 PAS domain S-box protein [Pseudomonas fluorescens]MBD8744761.1 PAS domain S-box protein [Pseudomonas fluorescens]MBD8748547.1 PAS domain S-box protein [Pseudomonas fluorescens]MBD8762445.1 PAS domain S-box protein [Pseudomonas fluorescens]